MEKTNVAIIFAIITTSKSTYYLLYDKSHSKTHTTTIPFSILLQISASPVKKQEKIGICSKNRKTKITRHPGLANRNFQEVPKNLTFKKEHHIAGTQLDPQLLFRSLFQYQGLISNFPTSIPVTFQPPRRGGGGGES